MSVCGNTVPSTSGGELYDVSIEFQISYGVDIVPRSLIIWVFLLSLTRKYSVSTAVSHLTSTPSIRWHIFEIINHPFRHQNDTTHFLKWIFWSQRWLFQSADWLILITKMTRDADQSYRQKARSTSWWCHVRPPVVRSRRWVVVVAVVDRVRSNLSDIRTEIDGWGLSPRGAGYLFGGDVVNMVNFRFSTNHIFFYWILFY